MVEHQHPLAPGLDQGQVRPQPLHQHLGRGDVDKAELIAVAGGAIGIRDPIVALAPLDQVEVVAQSAREGVITAAAHQHIVARPADQLVMAVKAFDPVGINAAVEPVVGGGAAQQGAAGHRGPPHHAEGILPPACGLQQGLQDLGPLAPHPAQPRLDAEQHPPIGPGTLEVSQVGQGRFGAIAAAAAGPFHQAEALEQGGEVDLGGEEEVELPADRCKAAPQGRQGQRGRQGRHRHVAVGATHQPFKGQDPAVDPRFLGVAGEHGILHTGPGEEDRLDQRSPLGGAGEAPLLQQARQGGEGIGRHHLVQAGHGAHASQVRQGRDGGGHRQGVGLAAAGDVNGKPHVREVAAAAGAAEVGAELTVAVALAVQQVGFRVGEQQAPHAHLFGGEQFAPIGEGIGVSVNPNPQALPGAIAAVDLAVAVGIEAAQGFKAIAGQAAAGQAGGIAEEFVAVGDAAVAIEIPHQQPVARAHPAGAFGEAVAVMVEVDRAGVDGAADHTVAIEVEHQR